MFFLSNIFNFGFMNKKLTVLITFCSLYFFIINSTYCQKSPNLDILVSYGIDLPFLDMQDRFGLNYNAGIELNYNTMSNYFFGLHSHILIGSTVKEDPISNLRNQDGNLIGQQKQAAIITLKQRGFLNGAHFGKFFNISRTTTKHGPRIRIGTSVMSHFIIFNDESATVNQLLGPYAKGYNRLSRGITAEGFIGYQLINKNESVNMFGGFEFIQGFTKNVRPVDFDTRVRNDNSRKDILVGFRIGVSIKLFEFGNGEEVFY